MSRKRVPQEKDKIEDKHEFKEEHQDESMKEPLTFEEIDYSDLKKLPINKDGLKSLILKGNTESYPVWIPTWNVKKNRLEKTKLNVKPVSQGDWDYCIATSTEDHSFTQLILSKSMVDDKGTNLTLEDVASLPIGVPVFLMKEIRKLSGHFESPIL